MSIEYLAVLPELERIEAVWDNANQHELVQNGAIAQVDARLANPDRTPEGYSATAVVAVATQTPGNLGRVERAVFSSHKLESAIMFAGLNKETAEDNNNFAAYLDKEYGKQPSAQELAKRQQAVDAAEQAIQNAQAEFDNATPTYNRGRSILDTRQALARGAMLLACLPPAVVLGGGYGGFFWYALNKTDLPPTTIGGQETNDPNAPGAHPIYPTAPEGSKVTQNPDGTYTITTSITQDQQAERAINAFAPTCELTGTEAAADQAAAQKTLQLVKDANGVIKRLIITGYASDEARGRGIGLGQPNDTNKCLSEKRLEVGVSAVQTEADKLDVQLPEATQKESKEVILDDTQIAEIDALAAAKGLSRSGLINNYNGDRSKLDKQAITTLDKLLGNNRGITIELTVEHKAEKKVPNTEPTQADSWAEEIQKYKVGGIGMEWILGGVASLVGGLFGISFTGPVGDRLARYRAQRIMQRAQRAIAKLAR